jgi:endonuclease III
MKNATKYQRKVRKLLQPARRARPPAADGEDAVRALTRAVLEEDATDQQAQAALEALLDEFVDYNELRVAPPKDLVECLGREMPAARRKAHALLTALNELFSRVFDVSLDHLQKLTKRELRQNLLNLGLSPYAAARLVLSAFGGHAVPVDRTLVECLEMHGYVHPGSDVRDVQGFLERIVPQKDAQAAHAALRAYVAKSAKALAKKRRQEAAAAEAEARQAAEQARRRAEQARRAAEAPKKKTRKTPSRRKAPAKAARSAKTAARTRRKAASKAAGKTAGTSPKARVGKK